MAADPSLDWVSSLPWRWSYGITQSGRVFFINEEAKSTTWLHPVTGEAVVTGHRKTPDLPTGWEEGYTFEGARYYINHNERKVTCKHPVTAQPSQDNCIFVVNEQNTSTMASQEKKDRTVSMLSDTSNCSTGPPVHPASPLTRSSRSSGKLHNFGKRSNSIKRNPNAPVIMRSWLYKKANSGMKLWKKRWFVLSDLCLFYYRDEKEEGVLGSILLPSFQISMMTPEDHINRMYAFKATHSNMRTYYFCTDTAKEMGLWMNVMSEASLLHTEPPKRVEITKCENIGPQEINHIPNHRLLIKPEANNNEKNKEVKVEEKKAREAEKYGFQKDGQERPLTKISSVKHYSSVSDYEILAASTAHYRSMHVNGPGNQAIEGHLSEMGGGDHQRVFPSYVEPERVIQRTNSMLQLEQWIKTQREKGPEEETRGVMSYQTLPRNMPSYRAQIVPRYPEGYRTLPRNLKTGPESLCSTRGTLYDRTMLPMTSTAEEKRKSIRDDTMWQLYEWQQRQFYNKQTTIRRHGSLNSPKTMIHISDQALPSMPYSPSHGSISGYHTYSPHRSYRSEVSSPVQRGDLTLDRRQKLHPNKHAFASDRRSVPAGLSLQPVTPQGLQDKTNEILSHHLQRNLIYVDHQMKENEPLITMVHTMIENSALRPQLYKQMTPDDSRATMYKHRPEEVDIDAKLSRLCEQDKVVQAMEEKLQQLHKEKHTLEQALLSVSQEIEMNADSPAAIQSVILQRDDLQNGLLSTCREVSRASAELERLWREYEKLEHDVSTARNQMREQLNRLGEAQTESAGIQRAQMQKELWRIQDVMEGLSKHKPQRRSPPEAAGDSGSNLFSSGKCTSEEEEVAPPRPPLPRSYDFSEQPPTIPPLPSDSSSSLLCYSRGPVHLPDEKKTTHVQVYQRNGSHCGPDYRLYKSEPELTTVAEVDESNGDEKTDVTLDIETSTTKGSHFPVGVVPPRTKSPTLESLTIASYVTLRKNKKIEPRTGRPRSAVEQFCITESPRPRMTVEEQMERMKRHQQACLKEKKRGLSFIGALDQSLSQSPCFSRENSLKTTQIRKKEEKLFSNFKDIENAVRENNLEEERESPAQEINRLKEAAWESNVIPNTEPEDFLDSTRFLASESKEEEFSDDAASAAAAQRHPADILHALVGNRKASLQVVSSAETSQHENTASDQERTGILFSYEFSTDALRRHTSLEAGSLSSLPEPPTLPAPPAQPQLTEGSHFMCV
ncbi:pleckstrin homology domain-containing family A member 5 isoform X5 [Ascaphus truei]|uniref:pleckstrin homology domain-containing family A member 5 isoform X5 n=1 Tax=Ascaphus truei TaxID=8439 RepID=UPI003F5976CB